MEENGIGCSESTKEKNDQFRKLVRINISAWRSIMKKHSYFRGNYTYIDLNAGPGFFHGFGKGSPIIFLEEIKLMNMRYVCHLFEINKITAMNLEKNIKDANLFDASVNIYNRDNCELINLLGGSHRNNIPGLIYSDPTGKDPPFDLLGEFSRLWNSVDILIYFSGANKKRQLHYGCNRLTDDLRKIHRTNCMIREPMKGHQWSFAYLTNGPLFEWKNKGFYDISSDKGQEILKRLTYTREELNAETQPALFDLSGISEASQIPGDKSRGDRKSGRRVREMPEEYSYGSSSPEVSTLGDV